MTANEYVTYSDRIGHRSRRAWAVIVGPGDSVVDFSASSAIGVKFIDSDYEQSGKWSHTTYRVILPPGARLVAGHMGWETGTWREALADKRPRREPVITWLDAASALGVSAAAVMSYARAHQKGDARHFDEVDRKLAEADDAASAAQSDLAQVAVSFGSPTNRAIDDGFWEWPIAIADDTGAHRGYVRPVKVDYTTTYVPDPDLTAVVVVEVIHSSGYHGGYMTVRLAMPAGWTATHGPQTVW